MAYQPKNFDHLLGTPGFGDTLLKNHFTLYHGYVTNTNKLSDALAAMAHADQMGTPEYGELKRRFGWEWNGMRLHELYFGNMKNGGAVFDSGSPLGKKIENVFGGYEQWEKDFKATGAMRGIGWTVLYHDPVGDVLWNIWVNEHDMGHVAGCTPLLVLDVFEHAYMLDYGLKRADYINTFFNAIDWGEVSSRLK